MLHPSIHPSIQVLVQENGNPNKVTDICFFNPFTGMPSNRFKTNHVKIITHVQLLKTSVNTWSRGSSSISSRSWSTENQPTLNDVNFHTWGHLNEPKQMPCSLGALWLLCRFEVSQHGLSRLIKWLKHAAHALLSKFSKARWAMWAFFGNTAHFPTPQTGRSCQRRWVLKQMEEGCTEAGRNIAE